MGRLGVTEQLILGRHNFQPPSIDTAAENKNGILWL